MKSIQSGWSREAFCLFLSAVAVVSLTACQGHGGNEKKDGPAGIAEVLTAKTIRNASFAMSEQGLPGPLMQLDDGDFYPSGTGGDDPHMTVASDPMYADLDGDGDDDAVAILEWAAGDENYTGWKGVYAWQWVNEAAVPFDRPLAWQWNCADKTDEPLAVEIPGKSIDQPGVLVNQRTSNTCGDAAKHNTLSGKALIGVVDDVPVRYSVFGTGLRASAVAYGATTTCARNTAADESGMAQADGHGEPLLAPEDGAPPVSHTEKIDSMKLWSGELADSEQVKLRNGYVPVVVTWSGIEGYSCGWLKWET
jgi:hypothetical protein